MAYWIVKDGEKTVGKYGKPEEPNVPDKYDIEQIDNPDEITVGEWWFE